MNSALTLGEFVKHLAALVQHDKIAMPFQDERPWHFLFYDLKKSSAPGKPEWLSTLHFDWDGPYPKCRELSDFLQALHWNAGVTAGNPHYNTITLPDDVARLWLERLKEFDLETQRYFELVREKAKTEFKETRANNTP